MIGKRSATLTLLTMQQLISPADLDQWGWRLPFAIVLKISFFPIRSLGRTCFCATGCGTGVGLLTDPCPFFSGRLFSPHETASRPTARAGAYDRRGSR